MFGVIADQNTEGHLKRLLSRLAASEFAREWDRLGITVESFATLGLAVDADDRTVWTACQVRGLILVTANRNHDGEDSLEAAIRDGGPDALPVVTYGDADLVLTDPEYAELTSLALLELFLDLTDRPEAILGSGRVFIP